MLHSLYTLVFNIVLVLIGVPSGCFLWLPLVYIGREHAQAEYRYIQSHGGKRANCPWYCGFLPEAWTVKGIMDWLIPLIVGICFYVGSLII